MLIYMLILTNKEAKATIPGTASKFSSNYAISQVDSGEDIGKLHVH